jgi:stage II sporulation protein D
MRVSLLKLLLLLVVRFLLCPQLPAQDNIYRPDVIARFHINNGKYLIDRGDFLEAHAEFDTAFEMAESKALKAESLAWLAQLSSTFLDDPAGAIREYESLVANYPESEFYPSGLFQLGMLNYQQQKLVAARQWLKRFQKEFPNDAQAMTASYVLDQIEKYLRARRLPPLPPAPTIGKLIRVGLGLASEARISGGESFKAVSIQHEFRGEATFTARQGHLFSGIEDLGLGPLELTAAGEFRYKGRRYRGVLELSAVNNQVQVVNKLPIEAYLYSVVGSEMSPNWPGEALKAQAVAARTYAAYAIAHPIRQSFDLFDDAHSQAYNGAGSERASTRNAADETAGEVLEYAGRPILAYFMANNGGRSADAKGVFDQDLPYFQVQDDPFSQLQPLGHWERHFTAQQIHNALFDFGFRMGPLTDIRPALKDDSGRVKLLDIMSGSRSLRIRCRNQFRVALNRYVAAHNLPENVPDTLLEVTRHGDVYTITGGGWGHGVGMSQEGARARADAGQGYASILAAYYPLAQIAKLY